MTDKDEKARRKELLHSQRDEKRRSIREGLPVPAAMMKALFDYVDKRLASSECDDTLHHANIRVEALLSSTDADEAGKPREKHDRADEVMSSFATTAFPQRQFLLGLKAREGTAIVKQSATRNRFSKMRFPDTGIWPCRMAFADN